MKQNHLRQQRRRWPLAVFVSACIALLCGCTAIPEQDESPSGAVSLPESAAPGPSELEKRLAAMEKLAVSVTADFDGDGTEEAFALTGEESGGVIEGALWYVTGAGAEPVSAVGAADGETVAYFTQTAEKITAGSRCFALFAADYATENGAILLGVQDGAPVQAPVYGMDFRQNGPDYTILQSALDASVLDDLSMGRTYKPYYLYWDDADGAFHEYGAVEISRTALEELAGADVSAALDKTIQEESGEWGTILYRGNDTATINYRLHGGKIAGGAYGENYYRTYALDGQTATLLDEGEGVYLPALLPEIAVYPDALE